MARTKSNTGWRKERRQNYLEMKEYRYYIFSEGVQTEPLYFQHFKGLIEENPIYKDMVLVQLEPCGAETERVVNKAVKYVRENKLTKGQIWCVYDKDSFPAEHFNNAAQRLELLNEPGSDLHYHAAWSNECIEFWFLLHFQYYTSNTHRDEYRKILKKKFIEAGAKGYAKNNDETFDVLLKHGNPKLAIRYAKRILKDNEGKTPTEIAPGTRVHELVEELAKYLPEKERDKFI